MLLDLGRICSSRWCGRLVCSLFIMDDHLGKTQHEQPQTGPISIAYAATIYLNKPNRKYIE